jgi:TIR domain/Domain of unknown function (DUF4384)
LQRVPEPAADVFFSYASRDREKVREIAKRLQSVGVSIWRDESEIVGGENYGPKIVEAIKTCKALLLACTDASMRSKYVKQEIQLAWKYERPYIPLLVEPLDTYPEQVQFWLEGCQWLEVLDHRAEEWLPGVLRSLAAAGVASQVPLPPVSEPTVPAAVATAGLNGLLSLARFTDQIWPVPADRVPRETMRRVFRDLGAPQEGVKHKLPLGSQVCLAIELESPGQLLLLDVGTSGQIYCLCPSAFAKQTRLEAGRSYIPQQSSRFESFEVLGKPGREHLLAIIADEPLGLDWMPADPDTPARVLNADDIDALLRCLHQLEGNRWTALSTYFDITLR